MLTKIAYVDCETSAKGGRIMDIGAMREDGAVFHESSVGGLLAFLDGVDYIVGHNILEHDIPCLEKEMHGSFGMEAIDTLFLSALLFPSRQSHALGKEEKMMEEEPSNPVNDCRKAQNLLHEIMDAYEHLPIYLQDIYCFLLADKKEFHAFFAFNGHWVDCADEYDIQERIGFVFRKRICSHANIIPLIEDYPVELAYGLALLWDTNATLLPAWLSFHYPRISHVLSLLRNTPCQEGCPYCRKNLDIHYALKKTFGFDQFRTYGDQPLQQQAIQAAVDGKSLLAVFPTGGGKSLAFQLPALMAGSTTRGLTVVISPLQALMKDQVDSLSAKSITTAVTINGLQDPLERSNAIHLVETGAASMLYISPEQLRSKTVERLLEKRNVVRFVIDEAHCFSSWGQDFRIDYMFIASFIKRLQEKRGMSEKIAVSCFTATAKAKVIDDIRNYFKTQLNLDLALFATNASRENLRYEVVHCDTGEDKYRALRDFIAETKEPIIIYTSRTRRAEILAERLSRDGFSTKAYHGQMNPVDKVAIQDSFMHNETQVIVATSAFGMGVDKKDVSLVIHYDISSSLEDYVQEAGRAGRDPFVSARCIVLYNDTDLDGHFMLLNQGRLSISEIQHVWKAIKDLARNRPNICCSPLELARLAGWNESIPDVESRIKTAIGALELSGYVQRGQNIPHIYATSINPSSAMEAAVIMETSGLFNVEELTASKRIFSSLIAKNKRAIAGNDEAESRIDYIADNLGIAKKDVVHLINLMRQAGILEDAMDLNAYINVGDSSRKTMQTLNHFARLERFLFARMDKLNGSISLKQLNAEAHEQGLANASVRNIRTLLYFLVIKNYIKKEENRRNDMVILSPCDDMERLSARQQLRLEIAYYIANELHRIAAKTTPDATGRKLVSFSLLQMRRGYKDSLGLFDKNVTLEDITEAILYLSKINAISLDGGFLVLYNAIQLKRLNMNNRSMFKKDDYQSLDEFYRQKMRMIHFVGEYAHLMENNPNIASQYVNDYFTLEQKPFIDKYFQGEKQKLLSRNISAKKYNELFGSLSPTQSMIINDKDSRFIVVAAGPGSGKTFVLVHKLASLLLMEDVKCEQLLMLTFSRAAATEFKKRLRELVGGIANYIDIKTFHSYCFDLLGKIGRLNEADNAIIEATALIKENEVEPSKIAKSVLVIDEAQDIGAREYALLEALIENNPNMRVIAVGDDDQNIFGWRGSDAKYMRSLVGKYNAKIYEMTDNYRSDKSIVNLANAFVSTISDRMKTQPGIPASDQEGSVAITHHPNREFTEAIVEDFKKTNGSSCVLTTTNEEALEAYSVLEQQGIKAKIVQNLDGGFKLDALLESRYFLFSLRNHEGMIPVEAWEQAKNALAKRYCNSTNLSNIMNMLRDFEQSNSEKYMSDLLEFIRESSFEDFYDIEQETVYVSTVHKAKGKQFDHVCLLWNKPLRSDEDRRTVYLALTRAKHHLSIHTCIDEFEAFANIDGITQSHDTKACNAPKELLVQLTHKDVYLGFFKDRQSIIKRMRGGLRLGIRSSSLTIFYENTTLDIVRYSKSFSEKLSFFKRQGYEISSAYANFIVAWIDKKTKEESYIILPILHLSRSQKHGRQST